MLDTVSLSSVPKDRGASDHVRRYTALRFTGTVLASHQERDWVTFSNTPGRWYSISLGASRVYAHPI